MNPVAPHVDLPRNGSAPLRADALLLSVRLLAWVTVLLMALPMALLLYSSFSSGTLIESGALTLDNFRNILGHPAFLPTMGNTVLLGWRFFRFRPPIRAHLWRLSLVRSQFHRRTLALDLF